MKNYVSQRDIDLTVALLDELPVKSAHIQYLYEESSCLNDEFPTPLITWLEKWRSVDFHFENKRLEKRRMAFQQALDILSFNLLTGKYAPKKAVCDKYLDLVAEIKKAELEPPWRTSKPHSRRKEIFWIIIASAVWTPLFTPLWIKLEESEGVRTGGIAFTSIFILIWILITSLYYAKNSGPIFIGRYRICSVFIFVFAMELVTLISLAINIAMYGF
ncbi:MAG: hypothetical protein HOO88_01600 [Kiritimatiellaceae bacterium]|nr:hypothetical protein [Kiritimatiellaceae bacterium]